MIDRKTSAKISLAILILCAAALAALTLCFPRFFSWFFQDYHGLAQESARALKIRGATLGAFYACVPFAAAALYMLIRLVRNVLGDRVFIRQNVSYLRGVSWCCYAVCLITAVAGCFYLPLVFIACAMGVVGTLVRVVKNVMHAAVALQEENELTI